MTYQSEDELVNRYDITILINQLLDFSVNKFINCI